MGLLILSLDSQAKWEDWNSTDKNLYKAYLIASTLDYMQTKNALDNHYIEGNPFLGKYPSSDRILLQKLYLQELFIGPLIQCLMLKQKEKDYL